MSLTKEDNHEIQNNMLYTCYIIYIRYADELTYQRGFGTRKYKG